MGVVVVGVGVGDGEAVGVADVLGAGAEVGDVQGATIDSALAGAANPKAPTARASVAAAEAADAPKRVLMFMNSPVAVRRG